MRIFILSCILILYASVAFGQNRGFEKAVEATGGICGDYNAYDTTLGGAGSEMRHVLVGKFSIHLGFRF